MIEPIYIGSFGAALVLLAFVLIQFNVWKNTYLAYNLTNAVGSIVLIAYAWIGSSWPFVALNLVWAGVSLRGIWKKQKQ